jgi:hypothetical protein
MSALRLWQTNTFISLDPNQLSTPMFEECGPKRKENKKNHEINKNIYEDENEETCMSKKPNV